MIEVISYTLIVIILIQISLKLKKTIELTKEDMEFKHIEDFQNMLERYNNNKFNDYDDLFESYMVLPPKSIHPKKRHIFMCERLKL